MKAITGIKLASLVVVMSALSCPAGQAKDQDFIYDTNNIGRSNGVIMSDQLLELGMVNSNGLRLEGEQAIRLGNTDRACQLLQRSLEMQPGDMDGRILYASALEKKLIKQPSKKRDPKLFNFVVKQWYYILAKSEFHDQKAQAKNHLEKLVGTLPKWREKPEKYLAKVLIPEDGSVKVPLGSSKSVQVGSSRSSERPAE